MSNQYKSFFLDPQLSSHKQYEALRAYHVDNLSAEEIEKKFGIKKNYFYSINRQFYQYFKHKKRRENPYFRTKKPGPKERQTDDKIREIIISLREKQFSIEEIKMYLQTKEEQPCLKTIYNILKDAGYGPLPKRTKADRKGKYIPTELISPPKAKALDLSVPFNFDTGAGGILLFLKLVKELELDKAIKKAGYPKTDELSNLNYILSLLALKLNNTERVSDANAYALDRGLGLFAGLNVIPKASSLNAYSYKISRKMNVELIKHMIKKLNELEEYSGIINLDFKAIPHWGDLSNLEKNWVGARGKAMKSVLSLICQDQESGFLAYTDAQRNHDNQSESILEFVDFWREEQMPLKCLVFDSKFTTYENLYKLNQDQILFITLRRRGKKIVEEALEIPEEDWENLSLGSEYKRKHRHIKIHSSMIHLNKDYPNKLRQIIIKNHGRKHPTFLITNDLNTSPKSIIKRYGRRWLVEQNIAEQIAFFHLNQLSSSLVIKIDFELTLSLIAHSIYKIFAKTFPKFEKARAKKIYTHFIDNSAKIENIPEQKTIRIALKKKVHVPLLLDYYFPKELTIPWLNGYKIEFDIQNTT